MAATRPSSSTTTFTQLGVHDALTTLLSQRGIDEPFPIQLVTIPDAIAGRDVLGRGRTGSGKTLAFLLPLLTRLSTSGKHRQRSSPRALILAPTRELASQIEAEAAPLARALSMRTMTVFGGVGHKPQISRLDAGVDLLVATPGRLEDLMKGGHARLDAVEVTVLDEADHMADLGFLPAVKRILDKTPQDSQRLLFSATLDGDVNILVRRYMKQPVTHHVDPVESRTADVDHHVLHIASEDRLAVLVDLAAAPGRTVVFTRTKHGAKTLARKLTASGVPAVELHGNLAQNARARNLKAFTDGTAMTLVATDIAARGIHVDDVGLVIHADPPEEHKAFLHRSGRTARAGASGTVITIMTDAQVRDVRDLTRRAGIKPTTTRLRPGHPLLAELAPGERAFVTPSAPAAQQSSRPSRNSQQRSRRSPGRRTSGRASR
ncbi:MAG: DEAD/DEAH box helicase [Actinomycetes bacterium]